MNLQTDKVKKLFISLLLLWTGINAFSQTIVVDPTLVGTLVYSHREQQSVLNDIKDKENKIRNFQILIQQKMTEINKLQKKTYDYLSTVQGVVKNGKDIIYASTIAKDIANYQSQAVKLASGDPKLMTVIAKTEYELITRSVDLMLYINGVALQGGEKNLLDNKQRIDLCIHVVQSLREMRGLAYSVCRQIKTAKRNGVLSSLAPREFRYIKNSKSHVDHIIKDFKFMKKGGI